MVETCTPAQMNYTTIGDTVNLAKRLQNWRAGSNSAEPERLRPIAEFVTVKTLEPIQVRAANPRTAVRTH